MIVLTLPFQAPVWPSGLANIRTRRPAPAVAAATLATKPKPNTALQPLSTSTTRPTYGFLADQVLFEDQHVIIRNERKFKGSNTCGKEAGILMERLERVAEGMREMELEKLMGRVKGQVSDEERVLMEGMSREIVSRFMEKPVQYLQSRDVEMEEKLKDLNFLVGILEESCLVKDDDKKSCRKNMHVGMRGDQTF